LQDLSGYFEGFIKKNSIFVNKKVLLPSYCPEKILHREKQIEDIAKILAPSLKLEKPSNLFIYGKTGTGKTVTVRHVLSNLMSVSKKNNIPLKLVYVNCKLKKIADTEYRVVAQLAREFGKEIPTTGLPTDEVYNVLFNAIEKERGVIIIVLDEIDQLIKKTGDEILYNFTRIDSELKNTLLSIVGISNDLFFLNNLDPRVKSSLSEEEIVFEPYNAIQIQDILRTRVSEVFEEGVLAEGVIEKCAAYAARDHGDARRAIELLRVAAEIADRTNQKNIRIEHVDEAEEKIERDTVFYVIDNQPKQYQLTLFALFSLNNQSTVYTGDIYSYYKKLCVKAGLRPLTQRRISDILAEFDMLGLITAKVVSKGRYGRTREINLSIPNTIKQTIFASLKNNLGL